jgi:hypothetical protein
VNPFYRHKYLGSLKVFDTCKRRQLYQMAAVTPQELSLEMALVHLLINEIDNRNMEELGKLLSLIPINAMNRDSSDELLVMLLTRAWKHGIPEVIPVVFDSWRRVYPKEEAIPFYVQLFTIKNINLTVLKYTVIEGLSKHGSSYLELMSNLIMDHRDSVGVACNRAYTIYGESVSLDMLTGLWDLADEEENAIVLNHLVSLIREKAPYRKIPSWVLDFRKDSKGIISKKRDLPSFKDTLYLPPDPIEVMDIHEAPSDTELIQLLESNSSSDMLIKLKGINESEKLAIFKSTLERITYIDMEKRDQNSVLFRLYGPAILSPFPSVEEMRYGGQRMFISTLYPNIGDDGVVESGEWFTGSCDFYQCGGRIRRRWHAVRIPVIAGGWMGCYCSVKCVRLTLAIPQHYEGVPETDIATRILVDIMEAQLLEIGIQDRCDSGNIMNVNFYDTADDHDILS